MTDKKLATKIVTPEIVCSFPYLFEVSDYTNKYGLSVPIPETEKETINNIKKMIGNAAENKWGKKARTEIGKKIESPLRNGNDEKEDDEVYKDTIFFSANSSKRPGVVDRKIQPIMDQEEIYPGCIIRASINFYAYDFKGKKGVACGLQHVMKVRDGDAIGGRSSAESDFADYATDEAETADVF